MKRQKPKSYTIWIARTGTEPIVLSLRPLVILLAIGLPATLLGAVIFSFVHHTQQLSQRNSKLTEEAGSILERVEALESTLTHLQERAKISQDDSAQEDLDSEADATEEDAVEESDLDGADASNSDNLDSSDPDSPDPDSSDSPDSPDLTLDSEANPDLNSQPDNTPSAAENSEALNYSQSLNSTGGMGGPIEAEGLLAAARAKLPDLIKELEGEVEPALNQIIVREEAKPQGIPLKAKDTEVTSKFGLRPNPFSWGYEFHQGIDFVADYGSPIYATASGTVTKAEWEPGYGNHVIVDHGYGLETLYAHLSDIKVNSGDRVDRNQVLGYLGNTGRSSGPHLHYSVFRNGKPVDPKKYLN